MENKTENKKMSSMHLIMLVWLAVLTIAMIIGLILVNKSLNADEYKTSIMRSGVRIGDPIGL